MTPTVPRPRLTWLSVALAAVASAGPAAISSAGAQESSATLDAYRRGWRVLDRAAAAMGGWDRLASLEGITAWLHGSEVNRFQSPGAEPPFRRLDVEMTLVLDLDRGRLASDVRVHWPDFTQHVRRVAGPSLGVIAWGDGPARVDSTLRAAELAPLARRMPHLLLLAARSRPAGVRHLGRVGVDGRPHDVVVLTGSDGELLSVFVDAATGRVAGHERLVLDWRAGDAVYEMRYGGWTDDGPLPHPRRIEVFRAGQPLARAAVDSLTPRVAALSDLLARHDSAGSAVGSPPSDGTLPDVRSLGEGMHLVEGMEGRDYNVLFVRLGDALAAVDAPLDEEASARALAAARRVVGELPLRWVIPTHHHGDHAGGVRAFASEGATVLTTPGNVGLFTDVVTATRSLAADPRQGGAPHEARIEEIRGDHHVLEAGGRRLHLHDVGPNAHADEHLVVHLPWAGILFQGDLVRFPREGGLEPARRQAAALLRLIEEKDLEVETIVGTHGRPGTVEELRAALEAARAGGG